MTVRKPRLGFLISGRGSNMRAIVDQCKADKLFAEPAVVISNNADAVALTYASDYGLPALHINDNTQGSSIDEAMIDALLSHGVDWVILAGYMQQLRRQLLKQFQGRIVNIHPSLLPKHGGKGMYGLYVHQAVLDSGDTETGATVHLVDEDYDSGKILAYNKVLVQRNDTAESLASRVLALEHQLYWRTLSALFQGLY